MKNEGHVAGGYLVSSMLVDRLKPETNVERNHLLLLGSFAGFLPDLDFIYYAIKKRGLRYESDFRHHTWITHTFPFYWLPALFWFILGKIRNQPKKERQALIFAAGATTHLIQDTVGSGDGIMLFYPVSRKMYGIGLIHKHGKEWKNAYEKNPIYLVELILLILAIISFFINFQHSKK